MRAIRVLLAAGIAAARLAPPASAGGVDRNGTLSAAFYNSTPYTVTLAGIGYAANCTTSDGRCWYTQPAGTIPAGGASLFSLAPNANKSGYFSQLWGYDAWFSYRVDVVGGPSEYITVGISQCQCSGIYGNSNAALDVWNTTTPPASNYDPAFRQSPGTQTANPQINVNLNTPTLFDPTITAVGNFTADGSTDLGQPFVDLLNAACGNSTGSCSFDATTPVEYIPGPLGDQRQALSCDLGPPPPVGQPADDDPNYYVVEYEAVHTTTSRRAPASP